MTKEVLKKMYQLLLTEPHAPTLCDQLESIAREALAQPEHPLPAIRALTEQCAALVWERDELKKQIQQYEKSGVTCQTYRHKVGQSCAECNVHETYTTPTVLPEREPVMGTKTWFEDGKVVTQHLTAKDIYKEPEQAPVAWITQAGTLAQAGMTNLKTGLLYGWKPLYTTPPKEQQ